MKWKIIGYYFLTTVILGLILIGLFWTPFLSNQKILLFRGLGFLLVATIITRVIMNWFSISKEIRWAAMVWAVSINLVFLVLFPVTLDRSITTYLLATVAKDNDYEIESLSKKFVEDYVVGQKAVERRLDEQRVIGLVTDNKNEIKLTKNGQRFLWLMTLIKRIYRIENK